MPRAPTPGRGYLLQRGQPCAGREPPGPELLPAWPLKQSADTAQGRTRTVGALETDSTGTWPGQETPSSLLHPRYAQGPVPRSTGLVTCPQGCPWPLAHRS